MFLKLDELFTRTKRRGPLSRLEGIQLFFCLLFILLHLFLLRSGQLGRLEHSVLDYFFRERPSLGTHPSILLLDIDQESLQAIGDWPWPSAYYTEVIQLLGEWQAKAVVFALPLEESSSTPEETASLAEALQKKPVYFGVALTPKTQKKIWVHSLPIVLEREGEKKIWHYPPADWVKNAKALGHLFIEPDPDGIVRRVRPILAYESESYPQLALRVGADFWEESAPVVGDLSLPLDANGQFLINWAGKWRESFPRISFADLVRSLQAIRQGQKSMIRPERVKDKICLIGLSAPGVENPVVTPLETRYPAFGVHATVLNGVLTQRYVKPVSFQQNAWILIGIGVLASFLFVILRNVPSFLAGLALGGFWAGAAFLAFWQKGLWFTVAHPLLLLLALFIFSALYDLFIAGKESTRLFDLATRDGLTGLYVIRHFRETLNEAVAEAQRKKTSLSLILIDIDDFKPINDTYGHAAGDRVLRQTAQLIHTCFRTKRPLEESDFVARYGGEEFIVMLRGANLRDVAMKVAERIRKAVAEARFEWEGKLIPVTISLGVATLHPGELVPDLMVRRADEALYHAKRHGKNRVSIEDATAP